MTNLDELVKLYKESKSQITLNEIYKLLKNTISKKAEYVFYQQKFKIGDYYFKLKDTHLLEKEDVEQELWLELMRLIENCHSNKSFSTYFYSTMWYYKPRFINKEFINQLRQVDNIKIIDDEEVSILDNLPDTNKYSIENINLDEMFDNLTLQEKFVLNILIKNPKTKQSELSDTLVVTHQYVSKLFDNIRKKYKS